MKNRNKIVLTGSLFITFLVLLIVFLLSGASFSPGMWVILSFIIIIACASLFFALYFNRKNNQRVQALNDEYKSTFFHIQDLITLHFKSFKKQKEVTENIIEIFEHAQLENRNVNEIVNNDIESFVKEFLDDQSSKFNVLSVFLYCVSLFIFFLIFMKIYKVFRGQAFSMSNFETETLDVGITLTYFIISFVFYPLLMWLIHYSAKKQFEGAKRLIIVIPTFIPLLLMGLLIFIDNEGLRNFLDTEIVIFGNIYAFVLGIIVLVITGTLSIYTKEK